MAKFIVHAQPAEFIRSGDVVLCTALMRAAPIVRQVREIQSEAQAVALLDDMQKALRVIGQPYTLSLRLADYRAPRGFRSWAFSSRRRDESFGQYVAAYAKGTAQ